MKSLMFSAVAFLAAIGAFADATVERVLIRQQWPWDDKVAIDFVLTNVTAMTQVDCAVYLGGTRVELPDGAFSGDVYELTRDGAYRIMFDPSYIPGFPANGGKVRFDLTPSVMSDDSRYREVLYKIFDLENATVTDVTRGALLNGRYGSIETDYSKIGEGYSSPLSDVLIWTGVTNYPGAKTTKLVMRKIPAGSFEYPKDGKWSSSTKYTITVSKPFYIGVFELTQKQYAYFKNEYYAHGDYFKPTALACNAGDEKPLQNFGVLMNMFNATARNWWEADAGALKNLKEKFSAAGTYNFDLPTEAMWYRAMRADSTTYYYDGIAETPTDFNYNDRMAVLGRFAGTGGLVDNGDGTVTTNGTVVVGQYRPNAFGLYDMLGNVMEATHDAGAKFAGSSTDPCNGVTSNGAGVFGNAWERDGEIWPQSEIVRNVHSTAKYPWIGVRLAFFEGAHPNKPVEE